MIHSLETRKRCFSKKKQSLKCDSGSLVNNSRDEFHNTDGDHQTSVLESVVPCDNEEVRQRQEIHNDTDAKQRACRVSRCVENGTGNDRFISKVIWNPEGGGETRASLTKSVVIKICRDNDDTMKMADHVPSLETSGKGKDEAREIFNDCSAATPTRHEHNFQHEGRECYELETIQVSEQSHSKLTDANGEICESTLIMKDSKASGSGKEVCEIPVSIPQQDKDVLAENDDFSSNIWSMKADADEIMDPNEDVIRKGRKNAHTNEVSQKELLARECSLGLNASDGYVAYSDFDKPKFCVNTGYCAAIGNNHCYDSKHGFVPKFEYCLIYPDDKSECEPSSTELTVCDQPQERKIPIITVDSMDYCNLEYEAGPGNSDFKSAQLLHSFPALSECNVGQNKNKGNHTRQGFKISRSHSDVSSLTVNRNMQLSYSADIFYESLSGPEGTDVINHSAEGMSESRRQSLEDVVPELPSRFLPSSDRFGHPSGFVQNLFWWRRPSDITDLRSRTEHPCEEENTECEAVTNDSPYRRYSDNVFCKPKKFLTLRFNQLREMWNKLDKHSAKTKPSRTPSIDSIEVAEVCENTEDPEFRRRQEEKNELIINTLREVVRKCTIMDPMQRPPSEEVYKKLKKLLLK